MTIEAYSRGRTHYNIYKDKGLKKNKYGPTSVTIGNNMTSIGRQSFEDCSVSPILPTSVRRQIIFRYGASLLRSHIDEQVSSTLASDKLYSVGFDSSKVL